MNKLKLMNNLLYCQTIYIYNPNNKIDYDFMKINH